MKAGFEVTKVEPFEEYLRSGAKMEAGFWKHQFV